MNKFNLFSVDCDTTYLPHIDNDKLAQEVLSHYKRLSDDQNSCLFEDTEFNPLPGSEGYKLFDKIEDIVRQKGYHIWEWWSQIHHPLESTNTHSHGNYELAFVYYVKVPEGAGDLVFKLSRLTEAVKPEEHKLIIFPAWLEHYVAKNMGKDIRISIAGNIGRP